MGAYVNGGAVVPSQQFGLNRTDVFSVDQNGQLNVSWVDDAGTWNGPKSIGPPGIAIPGCITAASQQFGANQQTDVFLVDNNGQLNVFWVNGAGAWAGPQKIGPAHVGSHAGIGLAASQQFGANQQTDVFLVGNTGQVNVFWVNGTSAWNGPQLIGPPIALPGSFIAASQQFGANEQTDVFLIDQNGQLNVFWVNGAGAWQGPEKIGSAGITQPGSCVAVSQQFGANQQTDVFLFDNNGQLNVFWVNGAGAWQGPEKIGPVLIAEPGSKIAVSQQFGADQQTDLFFIDKNGLLNVCWVNGAGAWQGPEPICPTFSGVSGGFLAASQQFGAIQQTDVFLVNRNGELNVFSVNAAEAWQGPLLWPPPPLGELNLAITPAPYPMLQGRQASILVVATDSQTGAVVNSLPVSAAASYSGSNPVGPSSGGLTGTAFNYSPQPTDTTAVVYVKGGPSYLDSEETGFSVIPPPLPPPAVSYNFANDTLTGEWFPSSQCTVRIILGEGFDNPGPFMGNIFAGIIVPSPCSGNVNESFTISVDCQGLQQPAKFTISCMGH
jgi:hypothetical protein